MRIRKAVPTDLRAVAEMSRKYEFETNRDWRAAISSKDSEMFLLVDGSVVVGFTGLIYNHWNETIQILDIFIRPEHRGHGLGLKLVSFLISRARAKRSDYRCLIAEAPSAGNMDEFYKKAGFRKCGYNDRYYSNDGKNIALWMSMDLR